MGSLVEQPVYHRSTTAVGAYMGQEKVNETPVWRRVIGEFQRAINAIQASTRKDVFLLRDILDLPVDIQKMVIVVRNDFKASIEQINAEMPKWTDTVSTIDKVISGVDFFALFYYFASDNGLRQDIREMMFEIKELRQVPARLFSILKNFADFIGDACDIVRLLEWLGAYDLSKVSESIGNSSSFGKDVAEFGLKGFGQVCGVASNLFAILRDSVTLANYRDRTVYRDDRGCLYTKKDDLYFLCDGAGNPIARKDEETGQWVAARKLEKTGSTQVAGKNVTDRELKSVLNLLQNDDGIVCDENKNILVIPDNQLATYYLKMTEQKIAPLSHVEKAHHGLNIAYKALGIILIIAGTAIAADSATVFVVLSLTASGIGAVVVFTDFYKGADRKPSQMVAYEYLDNTGARVRA